MAHFFGPNASFSVDVRAVEKGSLAVLECSKPRAICIIRR
jgi:hypothetical protein